jgi:hypothetical protein
MNLVPPQNMPPPSSQVLNDPLLRALSPIQEMLSQRQKVENIMRKYGRQAPRRYQGPPTYQWEGDTNA